MVSKTVKKSANHFKSKGFPGVPWPQSTDLAMQSTERERQLWAQLANSRAWVDPIEESLESELHEGSALEQVQRKFGSNNSFLMRSHKGF